MTDSSPPPKLLPFLKWAGGKRWLATKYPNLFPPTPHHLIEPFCGSSAVFFSISPETATLSDTNARLIECYLAIRDDVSAFMEFFHAFSQSHSREFYYRVRRQTFQDPSKRAAQFLYLNRVCFNGIYRENLLGQFNVPMGTKPKSSLKTDNFPAVSRALQPVRLVHCDFQQTVEDAQYGDFLYVDPPYATKHKSNGFTKYNRRIFSWADQKRLATAVTDAHNRGVMVVASNADDPDVRALYRGSFRILALDRPTVIASKSSYRGRMTEMVATNVL